MNYSNVDIMTMKKMVNKIVECEQRISELDDEAENLDEMYRRMAEEDKFTIKVERSSMETSRKTYAAAIENKYGKSLEEIISIIIDADTSYDVKIDLGKESGDKTVIANVSMDKEAFTKPMMEMESPATKEEAFDPFEHLDDADYVPFSSEKKEDDLVEEVDRDEELGFFI